MGDREALAAINATLKAKGFREKSAIVPEFEGQVRVHGRPVDVSVIIPDVTFTQLPIVRLRDRSQVDPIIVGHLQSENAICFASAVGLPLDALNPGGSILRVLEASRAALEVNYKGRGVSEVAAEYQEYWRTPLRTFRIFASPSADDKGQQSLGYYRFRPDSGLPFFALREAGELPGARSDFLGSALLIRNDVKLGPAQNIKVPMTLAELEKWFLAQPGFDRTSWGSALATLASRGFVAIAAPNCVLGVRLQFPVDLKVGLARRTIRPTKLPALLTARASSVELSRYGGFWCDQESLAERNLKGMTTLASKRIALVGCGTIGSHLAKFLVQSGAGARAPLFLFDRQLLAAGNIGRHYLGTAHIGLAKAEALRDEMKRFHPDCDVRAICGEVFDDWEVAKSCELIIDATGDWNAQNALSLRFFEDGVDAEALLHTWVCGNGAAVQTLLSLRGDDFCFRCMRPDATRPSRYTALNPKFEAVIQEATCGDGAYYPYSVAAPAIAAGLALEATLGWANGKPGSRLRTLVVDAKRGIERKPLTPTPHEDCPACKARAIE